MRHGIWWILRRSFARSPLSVPVRQHCRSTTWASTTLASPDQNIPREMSRCQCNFVQSEHQKPTYYSGFVILRPTCFVESFRFILYGWGVLFCSLVVSTYVWLANGGGGCCRWPCSWKCKTKKKNTGIRPSFLAGTETPIQGTNKKIHGNPSLVENPGAELLAVFSPVDGMCFNVDCLSNCLYASWNFYLSYFTSLKRKQLHERSS